MVMKYHLNIYNCLSLRFSDISGVLDEKIFANNYSFLDEYRESEIKKVTTVMKKVKNQAEKDELKAELTK